ncbi:MAG: CRISPR-associated protein Csy2 [Alteromonadaceae bacterium]|jgi:CRISPR-associated protein Csy2
MDTFEKLIAIPDLNERHRAVKRIFSLSTEPFDISSKAVFELAIIALINLTEPLDSIDDIFCRKSAKCKLFDEGFIKRCINTYQYRHSHNVKFPDYRARGALRLKANTPQFPKECFPHSFGYAQNAADINYSIFLCAEFIYKDELHCIGSALTDNNVEIGNTLINLGLTTKSLQVIKASLESIPKEKTIESLTGNYLPQVRFPFFSNHYLSITPVISNEIQSKVHQYCAKNFTSSFVYNLERSANVGSLAASVGGKLKLFKSLPKGLNHYHTRYDDFWRKNELLDILTKYEALNNALITSNEKSMVKNDYFKSLVNNIKYWKLCNRKSKKQDDVTELTKLLNLDLSHHNNLSKYSYQPEYSKLFKRAFQHITKNLGLEEPSTVSSESAEPFILIPNLRINDANAMSTGCTVGFPSLIGIWGFIHKFERNINDLNISQVKFDSFALCIHDFCLSKRTPSKEAYRRDKKNIITPGLIDSIECDLSVSLVLRVSSEELLGSSLLQSALPTHLCGGSTHLNLKNLPQLTHVQSFNESIKLIDNKHGKWLIPQVQEKETLSEFLDGFKLEPFFLVNSGYMFLEQPTFKEGVLGNLQHAFSENILNCARLVKHTYSRSHTRLFWSYKFSGQSVFLSG